LSNRKNNNSILFLTTLGVYFGLLMAGASPGVFAQQAALARSFDVKDEIEINDDLDKKPDDLIAKLSERSASHSAGRSEEIVAAYANLVENFLRVIDLSEPFRATTPISLYSFPDARGNGRHSTGHISLLSALSASSANDLKLGIDVNESYVQFSAAFDLPNEIASRQLFASLRSGIEDAKSRFFSRTSVELLNMARVKRSGNSILIVTHLPRAALDELLAKNAL
jgi:hypothetical protein